MSRTNIFSLDWSSVPFDIITSTVPYLPPSDILNLCVKNDSFNRRVCQDQDSIVWKLLFQRDISDNVPTTNIANHYIEIMDRILPLPLNNRLLHGARKGYLNMVRHAIDQGANIHVKRDLALFFAAENGYVDIVRLLLDRGVNDIDSAFIAAVKNGHTDIVNLLLDRGANINMYRDMPIRTAKRFGNTDMIKLLLSRGASSSAL